MRAAILGTGGVASLHADALAARDDVQLTAVSDVNPARATEFAATFGATAYPDLETLLASGIDVLHVCTPPGVHADQTIAALDAGVNVVLEKPPALSLAELDRILDAAERSTAQVAIVFQQRTGSAAAHVKRLLDAGAFGRAFLATCQTLWFRGEEYYSAPWRGRWDTEGGGTTLGHGIHQLDLLAYLLGEWSTVSGALWRIDRDIETEDTSIATIAFEKGTIASVVTSVLSPRETSHVRIDAEFATIEVEHLYGHDRSNWRITPAPGVDATGWELPIDDVPSGHAAFFAEVYPAFVAGIPLPPLVGNPARSLELVTAIYRSAGAGRTISRTELADPSLRGSLETPIP